MARVLWTQVAKSDLDEILYYVSFVNQSPRTGERLFHEIVERIAEHAGTKQVGHRHPAAPESWCYIEYKRWLIFYQPLRDGIEVMRVIDAVRDLPRHLQVE